MNNCCHVTSALFEPSGSSRPLSMSPAHKAFRCLHSLGLSGEQMPVAVQGCSLFIIPDSYFLLSWFSFAQDSGSEPSGLPHFIPIPTCRHLFTPPSQGNYIQSTSPNGKIDAISFYTSHSNSDPFLNKTLCYELVSYSC